MAGDPVDSLPVREAIRLIAQTQPGRAWLLQIGQGNRWDRRVLAARIHRIQIEAANA